MIFEYSAQRTFNDSIDVVDIGNTALRCTNVKLDDYYIKSWTTFIPSSISLLDISSGLWEIR